MTEQVFYKLLDLWKICDKRRLPRDLMYHVFEMIRASLYSKPLIETYTELMKNGTIPRWRGTAKKLTLVSDNRRFGSYKDEEEEIVQRLTVTHTGHVYLTRYNYENKVLNREQMTVSPITAVSWMNLICRHLCVVIPDPKVTAVGSWALEIETEDGQTLRSSGCLHGRMDRWLDEYSDMARDMLEDQTLLVFNGDIVGRVFLCSCQFRNSDNVYYYQTDDPTIQINDCVEVPVGKNGKTTTAVVVYIERVLTTELPTQYGEIKKILGKAEPDEEFLESSTRLKRSRDLAQRLQSTESLFEGVKAVVDTLDIEELLDMGCPADEYDSESRAIADRLNPTMDHYQIAACIAQVLSSSFGHDYKPWQFLSVATLLENRFSDR